MRAQLYRNAARFRQPPEHLDDLRVPLELSLEMVADDESVTNRDGPASPPRRHDDRAPCGEFRTVIRAGPDGGTGYPGEDGGMNVRAAHYTSEAMAPIPVDQFEGAMRSTAERHVDECLAEHPDLERHLASGEGNPSHGPVGQQCANHATCPVVIVGHG
jgi:hypothetical protein